MKKTTILETKDYSKFTLSNENRIPNASALKQMIESMECFGWLAAHPLHVVSRNGKLVIVDGQHRYAAAKKLGIPVLYVVCEEINGLSISKINLAQKRWNAFDFVSSYHNQGNANYTHLLSFTKKHNLPLGISAKLLMNLSTRRSTGTHEIREGRFKVVNVEFAEKIASIIASLRSLVPWASNSSFVSALMKAHAVPKFSSHQFIQRALANPALLVLQPTIEGFLEMIEKIYNYRSPVDKKISIKFAASNH